MDVATLRLIPTRRMASSSTITHSRLHCFILGLLLSMNPACGQIFIDTFSNNTVADSDTQAGFWSMNLNNGGGDANAISESGGILSMTAGDDDGTNNANYSGVSLVSSVSSDFNFFSSEITFQVRGISFSGTTAASQKQLRLGLLSTAQSSYNSPDAVILRVRGDGTVLLGSKIDTPNSNSDGTSTHQSFDLGADNSVTGFDLTLGPATGTNINYTLEAFGGNGNTVSASFTLDVADWDGSGGNAALMLWAQEFNATGGNDHYTATVSNLTVLEADPPTPPRTRYLPTGNYNVLFVAFDDLKANFGAYVTPGLAEAMPRPVTPHLDTLASEGMTFTRAYCQQAVCWASRISLLTGCRPDTTKIWDDGPNFRDTMPGVITLPQHFANNGFNVAGYGKIYDSRSTPPEQDAALSWPDGFSSPGVSSTNSGEAHHFYEDGHWQAEQAAPTGTSNRRALFSTDAGEINNWASPNRPVDPDTDYADGLITGEGINKLNTFAADYLSTGKRFFLAVGLQKPHLPFAAPKSFWDLYDPAEINLSGYDGSRTLPTGGLPYTAATYEMASYDDLSGSSTISEPDARRLIHGYLAATSFADYQFGRLIAALEASGVADQTIIVIWGDHGWHLGDHNGFWAKHSCFEQATRSPLIIRAPGMDSLGTDGKACVAPVEFVDIYPTLVDLAGIATPSQPASYQAQGTSLSPLLEDPAQPWKKAAFSQYQRYISGAGISNPGNGMGYTMRTSRYRYTEWWRTQTTLDGNGDSLDRDIKLYGSPEFVELYDYTQDPDETTNLADNPAYATLVAELSAMLAGGNGWNTSDVDAPAAYPVDYVTWREAHDLPGSDALVDLAPEADPDNDRLTNLFEYKMGSHPWTPDFGLIDGGIENAGGTDYLTLWFNSVPSRTDASMITEQSSTLLPGSFTSAGVENSMLSSSAGIDRMRARTSVSSSPSRNFLRVQVE
jgi:iduronate 2-sulfatase